MNGFAEMNIPHHVGAVRSKAETNRTLQIYGHLEQ
jgi:hypothetical protein